MAADQRRKRMNSANVIGFSSREHYRAKRKKIGSPDGALRSGDHISLEWDRNRSKVVSKREQVGLSLRHLREFVDVVPSRRNLLAQVCPVPHESFQLENLSEVLSNEVWRDCLSDGDRNYLQQFLPEGVDVEQVVQALLDGESFHFGNPFLDWGTAVCSSKAHPDQIASREECLRDRKRRYYSYLEKYHNDIIDYLQTLKEKWESCKDPEKDAVKQMWGKPRGGNAQVNDSCQDVPTASESSSWNEDNKPCSSDDKISSLVRTGDVQRRHKSSAVEKEKSQDNVANVVLKARKKDKLPKHSIQQTDGAKYMSYLKISKKQHQIVTSMKQSGKSIQSRALNRILGNIDSLNVQPYGLFVEEEQKKLSAYWLQLVRDLPAAYAIWKKLQLQKRDIINSVGRELMEKVNPWMEGKQQLHPAENPLQKLDVQPDLRNNDRESLNPDQSGDLAPDAEDSGSFGQVSPNNHSPSKDSTSYGDQITDSGRCLQVGTYASQVSSPDCGNSTKLEDTEEKHYSSPSRSHGHNRDDVAANDYSSSIQCQSLPLVSFPSAPHASNIEDMNHVGKHSVAELENASSDERIRCITPSPAEDPQFCSGGNVWQPVGEIRQSYIGRQAYNPSGGLSIIHHRQGDEEEKNCFIDLESDMPEEVDRRKMLQRKASNSFGPFPNNDQNELLQSLFKGQGVPSRTTEQLHSLLKVPLNVEHKQLMGIGFQQEASNNLIDGGQFSGQFQHQMTAPLALSQDQQRQVDIYGQGNMSDNIYCDGRGFLMQRPDWNTSVAQIGVTTQPQLNTGPLLNQNWQFKSMWANTNGVGCASQGSQTGTERDQQNLLRIATNAEQIIHRGSSSDQSLFSVLSQCGQLGRPRTAFEPESSSAQVIASGNYGMLMGGGTTQISSNLTQPANPLDYLSGSNPATSLMPDDVAWMNQSRQNSGLHDPLGKLYPRSWNP
uniref:Nuclear factor related to kappa-B-binding protein n=1 Tax=Noccaea caerulescens TaxID=107243 RepID=A0A1J3F6T1_NOCCA